MIRDIVILVFAMLWAVAIFFVSGAFIYLGWTIEAKEYYIILAFMAFGVFLLVFTLFDILILLKTIELFLK